jgi:hypothetical protein
MTYEEFRMSKKGAALASIITSPATVAMMEALSRRGAPAVAALDAAVADTVGDLDHVERQQVGRWVRDILAQRGWRPIAKKRLSKGRTFVSGAVYAPSARPHAPAPAQPPSSADGLTLARELLREARPRIGTVDEFLAERRATWGDG